MITIDNFIKEQYGFIRPKPSWIKEKGWYCRVYLEYYDTIEASFIYNAISSIDKTALFFYIPTNNQKIFFKKEKEIELSDISNMVNMDDYDFSLNFAGITNYKEDYLYFKDAGNDFFMLFGTREFLYKAMPVDKKIYTVYYNEFYGNWASEAYDNILKKIWSEYLVC